jgi:hypothetical protein
MLDNHLNLKFEKKNIKSRTYETVHPMSSILRAYYLLSRSAGASTFSPGHVHMSIIGDSDERWYEKVTIWTPYNVEKLVK